MPVSSIRKVFGWLVLAFGIYFILWGFSQGDRVAFVDHSAPDLFWLEVVAMIVGLVLLLYGAWTVHQENGR